MTTYEVLEPHKPREDAKYGYCEDCGVPLSANLFTDIEFYPKTATPTGRTRLAVNYLYCPKCLKKLCVDDSFDGPWR